MQNIRLSNVCEAQKASRRHEKANVLHHPAQANNLNFNAYIYILYYQLNILNYRPPKSARCPYKMKYFICNRGVGTSPVNNVVTIRE